MDVSSLNIVHGSATEEERAAILAALALLPHDLPGERCCEPSPWKGAGLMPQDWRGRTAWASSTARFQRVA